MQLNRVVTTWVTYFIRTFPISRQLRVGRKLEDVSGDDHPRVVAPRARARDVQADRVKAASRVARRVAEVDRRWKGSEGAFDRAARDAALTRSA